MERLEPGIAPRDAVVRRKAPYLVIVNEAGGVAFARDDMPLEPAAAALVPKLLRQFADPQLATAVTLLEPTVALRAVRMRGASGTCYAIFREEYSTRNVMIDARRRYGLSARECEVITLLMNGSATGEIANIMCIAPSTVQAHVKNIARKTDSRKRTEVLAKVLGVTSGRLSLV
ncbi:MAG: hypothetical protein NVS3B28_12180 [Candidatus Velthaea sp.]